MHRLLVAATITLAMGCGWEKAFAAPPTVTPSPGYDARLQQSRNAAATNSGTTVLPVTPTPPTVRHHPKRSGHVTH